MELGRDLLDPAPSAEPSDSSKEPRSDAKPDDHDRQRDRAANGQPRVTFNEALPRIRGQMPVTTADRTTRNRGACVHAAPSVIVHVLPPPFPNFPKRSTRSAENKIARTSSFWGVIP